MSMKIAIIGASATGIATYIRAVRKMSGRVESITTIDPRTPGTGPVFGDPNPDLLCNTSAAIHSLIPENPDGFVDYCRKHHDSDVKPDTYTPRSWVGSYCRSQHQVHRDLAVSAGVKADHRPSRALRITQTSEGCTVHLDNGEELPATHVVIGIGMTGPAVPDGFQAHATHLRFIPSPYPTDDLFRRVNGKALKVLVLGSGLTAADTALLLCRHGHSVTMVSRSGILPAVRSRFVLPPNPQPDPWRITELDPQAPDLSDRLAGIVMDAIRAESADFPLNRQISSRTDPVERLREEIEIAEAGHCYWQDVIFNAVVAFNTWAFSEKQPDVTRLATSNQSLAWRYVTSLGLPIARELIRYIDNGQLRVARYSPESVQEHRDGFTAEIDDALEDYDYAVGAAGFHRPFLHWQDGSAFIGDPPADARRITSVTPGLQMIAPDGTKPSIWLTGMSTHVRSPFANFFPESVRQAGVVVNDILGDPTGSHGGRHQLR